MRPRPSNHSDRWAAFTAALTQREEKRPPGEGWLTLHELCKSFKSTQHRVRKALETTPHETFEGNISKNGKLVRSRWYRPVAKV